ncbi:MAG: laccase domain-containing protein, partial [Clostridia bacterium]|nr:laccase domain-containing protein [Clostridia bacterium]
MSFSNINEIGIKCDEIDALGGISHIFTTKNGGCSEGALSSLNMGINRPDSRENLINNYKTVCAAIGADYTKTVLSH